MKTKMKMKILIAMALAFTLLICSIGFSVFAGGPYTEDTIPGYRVVDEDWESGDGTVYHRTLKKIVFEYHVFSYHGTVTNESEEIWSQDVEEDGIPSSILNNGYSFAFMKELHNTPDYYQESSGSATSVYKFFRGWAFCDENGNLLTQPSEDITFTEENFGCYITPVYTDATSLEKERIEELAERSLVGYTDTWYDATTETYKSEFHYLGEGEYRIEKRELTGVELNDALSRAGVDEKNKVAWELEIYPIWGEEVENPCFIVKGKSIPVTLPKPDVEGADSFSIIHLFEDGTKEEIPATVVGNELHFLITSCSPFVPVAVSSGSEDETTSSETTTPETTTTEAASTTTAAGTDDAETTNPVTNDGGSANPGTGEGSLVPIFVLFVLSVLFACGTVGFDIIRKRITADNTEK